MTDNLDPSGPAQPSLKQAYETPGNPAQNVPTEAGRASQNAATATNDKATGQGGETRVPEKQTTGIEQATFSSLGHGIRGAGPGEEAKGLTEEDVGRHNENDGAQMAAPSEGKVADVVKGDDRPGATGSAPDLISDLDRKKAEQAPAREKIDAEKEQKLDVAGILSNRGGPANPVDKNNYPNGGVQG